MDSAICRAGNAAVVFFMSTECPISRFYATEIQRICSSSQTRGATFSLIYEDLPVTPSDVHLDNSQLEGARVTRAYLVDDEVLAVERLSRMLKATGRVEVVGESCDAVNAAVDFRSVCPDVLFLDIQASSCPTAIGRPPHLSLTN